MAILVVFDHKNYTQADGVLGNKCTDQFLMLNQLKMRVEATWELFAENCDKRTWLKAAARLGFLWLFRLGVFLFDFLFTAGHDRGEVKGNAGNLRVTHAAKLAIKIIIMNILFMFRSYIHKYYYIYVLYRIWHVCVANTIYL